MSRHETPSKSEQSWTKFKRGAATRDTNLQTKKLTLSESRNSLSTMTTRRAPRMAARDGWPAVDGKGQVGGGRVGRRGRQKKMRPSSISSCSRQAEGDTTEAVVGGLTSDDEAESENQDQGVSE